MGTKTAHIASKWGLIGAVFSGIAGSACCVLPLALLSLGVGGTWASRVAVLERYRPLFVALTVALLGFAFFRAYRPARAEPCSPRGSCQIPGSRRRTRAALWLISPPLLALLAFPYVVRYLPAHLVSCTGAAGRTTQAASDDCCAVPAGKSNAEGGQPQKESGGPIDPAREIVFNVENLQCPAVKGVGCGSLLAPVLNRINRVEGVSDSFSNWTGTRLRISASPGADRKVVAERVRAVLSDDGRQPTDVVEQEFPHVLRSENWHSAARLVDLSSYEFHTIAKRRIAVFADGEKLDAERREKLMRLADQLWDKAAEGLDLPGSGPGAYGEYWHARRDRFVGAYLERARDVLTPEQIEKLLRQYMQQRKQPVNGQH